MLVFSNTDNIPSFVIALYSPDLFRFNIASLIVKFAFISLYINEFVELSIVPVYVASFNFASCSSGLFDNLKLYKSEYTVYAPVLLL